MTNKVRILGADAYLDTNMMALEPQKINGDFLFSIISKVGLYKIADTSTIPQINNKHILPYGVNVPKPAEQTIIARFIEKLDSTIALHQRKFESPKFNLLKGITCFVLFRATQTVLKIVKMYYVWEQRKLASLTSKIGSGKTPKGGNATYTDLGVPLLRSQNIHDDKVDFLGVAYISSKTDLEMKNSRVNKYDVLLNITGASIGRSAVYLQTFHANVNQHVCIIRPLTSMNAKLIQMQLASPSGQNQVQSSQTGGGREGLNFQQVGKFSISLGYVRIIGVNSK